MPVNLLPVPYSDNQDDKPLVLDCKDHPVLSCPDPPEINTLELLGSLPGIHGQASYGLADGLLILLG